MRFKKIKGYQFSLNMYLWDCNGINDKVVELCTRKDLLTFS